MDWDIAYNGRNALVNQAKKYLLETNNDYDTVLEYLLRYGISEDFAKEKINDAIYLLREDKLKRILKDEKR